VADGVEREQHPFVTVMPTGDENLIQAMKQMKGEVGEKKSQLAKGKEGEEVKEETLVEKKKECKDGYERDDDGKCVKKSKKTTIIVGRGYGYGHHHNDDGEDDGEDTGSSGNDSDGGGVGEMFDFLGDLLLQEKLNSK